MTPRNAGSSSTPSAVRPTVSWYSSSSGVPVFVNAAGKLVLSPREGALIHRDAPEAASDAMALCLADVLARLEPSAKLRVLTAEDEDRLLNWDAEKYRQSLAKG